MCPKGTSSADALQAAISEMQKTRQIVQTHLSKSMIQFRSNFLIAAMIHACCNGLRPRHLQILLSRIAMDDALMKGETCNHTLCWLAHILLTRTLMLIARSAGAHACDSTQLGRTAARQSHESARNDQLSGCHHTSTSASYDAGGFTGSAGPINETTAVTYRCTRVCRKTASANWIRRESC